jgi:hypothetical protein
MAAAADAAEIPQPGESFRDPVSGAVILVLTAPRMAARLLCDGVEMVPARPVRCGYQPAAGLTLLPGRRYSEPASGLEVRCLHGGNGRLSYAGRALRDYLHWATSSRTPGFRSAE